MASKKTTKSKLNPNQIAFCEHYVTEDFFCNGVQSYLKAYPDSEYNTAKVNANKMLTNTNILAKINDLLDASGFNDEYVDKQLFKLVAQDEDKPVKLGGIREYNKLKSRITEKIKTEGASEDAKSEVYKKLAEKIDDMKPEEINTALNDLLN